MIGRVIGEFAWNGRSEAVGTMEINEFLSVNIPQFNFTSPGSDKLTVSFIDSENQRLNHIRGLPDLLALKLQQQANTSRVKLSKAICAIEIKTEVGSKTVGQKRSATYQCTLQLIGIILLGNRQCPFGLVSNATTYWNFIWISEESEITEISFDNQLDGNLIFVLLIYRIECIERRT